VAPGQLFVPFHYFEANANQVTQSAFDPISREPNYKQSAVRVEAAGRDSGLGTRGSGLGIRGSGLGTRNLHGAVESRIPDPGSRLRGAR
jgi:hypothetical protein